MKMKTTPAIWRSTKVNIAKCPLTLGLPTKATKEGFTRCCEKRTAGRKMHRGRNYEKLETTVFDAYCEICKGKIPDEVTIITLPE